LEGELQMVETKDLYLGVLYKITDEYYTGYNLLNFTTHYEAISIDNKTRLFFKKCEYGNNDYIDIVTGILYKKFCEVYHEEGDIVVETKASIIAMDPNVPTKVSKRKAYELAVKINGIELVGRDRPKLQKVFKKYKSPNHL
jgi:hypothetical protein